MIHGWWMLMVASMLNVPFQGIDINVSPRPTRKMHKEELEAMAAEPWREWQGIGNFISSIWWRLGNSKSHFRLDKHVPTTRQCLKCHLDGDVQLAPFWGSAWVLVTWLRHVRESQDEAIPRWCHFQLGSFLSWPWALDNRWCSLAFSNLQERNYPRAQTNSTPRWLFKSFAPYDFWWFLAASRCDRWRHKPNMTWKLPSMKRTAQRGHGKIYEKTSSPWILEHALDLNIKG